MTLLTVEGKRRPSVTNIGVRPTVTSAGSAAPLTLETHVLDFAQDLYGKRVDLEFFLRLREERKFPDKDALVAQIQKDVGRARRYFVRLKTLAPALMT